MYGRDQITIRDKCTLIQQILNEVAKSNDIDYHFVECTYEDRFCHGCCNKRIAELKKLEEQLNQRAKNGFPIQLNGLQLSFLSAREQYVIKPPIDFDMSITELDLSTRSTGCLLRAGIDTLGILASSSLDEIKNLENINKKCLEEICAKLEHLGLKLTGSRDGIIAEL